VGESCGGDDDAREVAEAVDGVDDAAGAVEVANGEVVFCA
jgi:hypothetical protein